MSRWQDAKPGIERAQCVMRPMAPLNTHTGHADYVRVFHNYSGHSLVGLYLNVGLVDGSLGFEFDYTDDHPRSRTISAERVESAVEIADFLAICHDEALAVHRYSNGDWEVWETGYMPVKPLLAQSLRGAYLAYHAQRSADA